VGVLSIQVIDRPKHHPQLRSDGVISSRTRSFAWRPPQWEGFAAITYQSLSLAMEWIGRDWGSVRPYPRIGNRDDGIGRDGNLPSSRSGRQPKAASYIHRSTRCIVCQ